MRRFAFLLIFMLLVLLLPAQKLRFVCQGCKVTPQEKTLILQMAQHELAFYQGIFQVKKIPTVRVHLYGDHKAFMRSQSSSPNYATSESGYYTHQRKEVCVYKDSNFVQTCFHEISHAIIATQCERMPTWINEGLAEYFEHARIDSSGHVTTFAPRSKMRWMQQRVKQKHFTIRKLVSYSYKKFHKHHEWEHYAASWGIVYYLVCTNKEALRNLVLELSKGKDSVTAIDNCYKGGMEQLDKDLVEFYK